MKTIQTVTILTAFSIVFAGCQSVKQPTPSQNSALNTISKSSAAKKQNYALQRSLDHWLATDWKENTKGFEAQHKQKSQIKSATQPQTPQQQKEKQSSVTKKDKTTKGGFLQYYVDKFVYYQEHLPKTPSHVEELEKMPVIGK